jgi:hypothetical protein
MGDQSKPVDDDVERALASMRAGFLSGSQQVAAHIAALDQHLFDAPGAEREAVRAQVARLVAAHDRITAKVTAAPATAWDGFKVMVNAVKQQQDVLGQINRLVQQHVVPRQVEPPQVLRFSAAPPLSEEPPPPPGSLGDPFPPRPLFPADDGLRADGDRPPGGRYRASDVFRSDDSPHAGARVHADMGFPPVAGDFPPQPLAISQHRPAPRRQLRAQPPAQSQPGSDYRGRAAAEGRDLDDDESERPSLLATLRQRTAGFRGLAAMVAVGIILSMLPRERLQEVGSKLFDLLGPAGTETASDDPPPKPAPKLPRSVDRVPSVAVAEAPEARPEPKSEPLPAPRPEPKASAPPPQKKLAAVRVEEAPAPRHITPPAPSEEPVAPPPVADEERFVAVVFTHKNHATVMRALTDLKQQYPTVLIGLEGEVQPVDMGQKGIWHRLVFLPAGPRPQASKVCEQLAAHGYDRCYVRTY